MFSFFAAKPTYQLKINHGLPIINFQSKESILTAALRSDIAIANSCRVGACASCKCKLLKGKVKELTDSSYVLSQTELDQGYILACQSIPKSNIEIEAQLSPTTSHFKPKEQHGVITAQQKLTQDITQLKISLDAPIDYVSGQYAELNIPDLCSASRAYSFATPANGNQVEFYIKQVNGGKLSPIINSKDLQGMLVQLNGPLGDFYLRQSDAPIVCIAGGSGLAPIKALLQQALTESTVREVIFYFGARNQQELYCNDEILDLKKRWKAAFTYIPVLYEEPIDSNWQGQRGLVTEAIGKHLTGTEHAYLCGPPLMIDAALEVLNKYKLDSSHIHFDKFLSTADIVAS